MRSVKKTSRMIGIISILYSLSASATTTITIVNADGPGEGFNDPTSVSPVGGNDGTTLGAQRLRVFEEAATIWASYIQSDVEIKVEAKFDPLTCNSTSAVLGSAGTTTVHRNFDGAPVVNTWYPQALANSLSGTDLSPANPDLSATFNSALDNNNECLTGINWYLGLDGNTNGDIDLLDVLLHEIGHGVGFASYVNESTGQPFFNYMDIYSINLEDHSTGLTWGVMNNTQRSQSAIDSGDLHFIGANVISANAGHARIYAPKPAQPGSSVSHFDTSFNPNELMEPFITTPPVHDVGLAFEALLDLGWSSANQPANTAPTIAITSPTNGSGFTEGESITFMATASDAEDGDLSSSITWDSNLDGNIGTGPSIVTSLSLGNHVITAGVTDNNGIHQEDQISVSVQAPVVDAPAAPNNVVVVDQQDGTARVTWQDNSNNETQFEILRESPHKKRAGVWTGTTIVATVSENITSYIDTSGTGVFHYCITAKNSGGSSASICSDVVEITDSSGGSTGNTFCDT
ncbi:MAG: Ig-like domain-containing protein, partial [Gammaproteobacteria bacterium]